MQILKNIIYMICVIFTISSNAQVADYSDVFGNRIINGGGIYTVPLSRIEVSRGFVNIKNATFYETENRHCIWSGQNVVLEDGFQAIAAGRGSIDFNSTDAPAINSLYRKKDIPNRKLNVLKLIKKIDNNKSSLSTIYPNPFKNEINISLNNNKDKVKEIKVFDINGKYIQTYFNVSTIDLSKLPIGTYLINVKTNFEEFKKTIIKKE